MRLIAVALLVALAGCAQPEESVEPRPCPTAETPNDTQEGSTHETLECGLDEPEDVYIADQ